MSFEEDYPYIAAWVMDGWVEIGRTDYTKSRVRAFDEGGMVFEGRDKYPSLDATMQDLDEGIKKWCDENGIDLGIKPKRRK